ncbi:MAG TPA: sialidase family protein [bacterium]|nr:sialidase family protein [bacterium]
MTFGSPRDIAEVGFNGLAQFANGFTLNRFGIDSDGTREAAIFGGNTSDDPQELLPNLSVTFAQDQGVFGPPILLAGEEDIVELIASVEMDSENNLHAFSSRVANSGSTPPQIHALNASGDGATVGEPIPLAPNIEPGMAQLFSNSTMDAGDGLHFVFSTLSAESENVTGPIYYVRSDDHGATWSVPKAVVGISGSPQNSFLYPSVVTSPDGETVVVSYFDVDQVQIRSAKSVDGGASFSSNVEVFEFPYPPNAIFSKVAMDASGKIYVVYSADTDGDQISEILLSSSDDGSSYGQPVTVNLESTNFEGSIVNMAIDSRGRIDVIWHSDPDDDDLPQILNFARSTDGGATFSSPVTIATAPADELVMNGGIRHDRWGHVFINYIFTNLDVLSEQPPSGSIFMLVGTPDDVGSPESCDDGSDNDFDGAIDCDDTECEGDGACVDDSGIGGEAEGGGCSIGVRSTKLGWAALFPATGLLFLLLQRRKARASSRA